MALPCCKGNPMSHPSLGLASSRYLLGRSLLLFLVHGYRGSKINLEHLECSHQPHIEMYGLFFPSTTVPRLLKERAAAKRNTPALAALHAG